MRFTVDTEDLKQLRRVELEIHASLLAVRSVINKLAPHEAFKPVAPCEPEAPLSFEEAIKEKV